ncbi:hypothetical protein COMNV_01484 [Commensalibacter sp. Nvir]|uniref:glycosyltransferase n=1 Tax=Commensalibacter sp. Nvir TaxID=3069817 RepID=UPI002D32F5C7|nr:hypothetical protein COMNV_01484 [Commensalibacter sp. Nvir]
MKKLGVKCVALIVTYNRLEKLQLCLKATCEVNFEVIVVVNNASTDGSAEWLDTFAEPRLIVIHSEKNLGGAGGFKFGSDYIVNHLQVDWICFYDDDAYPHLDLLSQFEIIDKRKSNIFCSKVLLPNGNICTMNLPYRRLPRTFYDTILYTLFPNWYLPDLSHDSYVETFSFVGTIIHQKVLKQFCEKICIDLFVYFDDLFFSYYLSNLGHKISFEPCLVFTHDTLISANLFKSPKLYFLVRNLLWSRKIFSQSPPFSRSAIGLRLLRIFFYCLIKGRSRKCFLFFFKGVRDGIASKVKSIH